MASCATPRFLSSPNLTVLLCAVSPVGESTSDVRRAPGKACGGLILRRSRRSREEERPRGGGDVRARRLPHHQGRVEVGVQGHGAATGRPLTSTVRHGEHCRHLPSRIGHHHPREGRHGCARRPVFIDKSNMTWPCAGARVVAREPSMARAGVGLTMVTCLPGMARLRSRAARNSYVNCQKIEECYE